MVLHPLHHPFHHGASPKMHDGAAPAPAAVPVVVPPAFGDYLMVAGIAGGVCAVGVFVRVIMGRRMKKTETRQGYTGYGSTPIREVHEMDQQGEFREYPERWIMLLLYAANISAITIQCSVLGSSQVPAAALFHVDPSAIVSLNSVMTFLLLPGTLFGAQLFHRFGVKHTCSTGLWVCALGSWIMVAAVYYKTWILMEIGVVVAGLAVPLMSNACTGLSASWFSINNRNLPTAVGSVGAGSIAAAAFNSVAVTDVVYLPYEFFVIATCSSVGAFLFTIIYREEPPTPPSREETSAERTHNINTTNAVKAMATDKNFLILLFCFAIDGYGWGMILVTSILTEIGYGQAEANQIMMIASFGSMSALVFSPVADFLKRWDQRWPLWLMQISQLLTFLATVGLSLVLKPGMFDWIFFFFLLVGIFSSAATPFLLELAAEVTYPVPESTSAGFCFTIYGLSTFGFVELSQVMKSTAPKGQKGSGGEYDNFIMLQNLLFCLSVILLVFVFKPDMKRSDCDKKTRHDDEVHDLLLGGSEEESKHLNVHRARSDIL